MCNKGEMRGARTISLSTAIFFREAMTKLTAQGTIKIDCSIDAISRSLMSENKLHTI